MSTVKKFFAGFASAALVAAMLFVPATAGAAMAGEVYKTTDGTVWFVTKDMQKRPFTSGGAFLSYGFLSFSMVKDADASVTSLPTGSFIPPQDGKIFCATETKGTDVKGECSLITGGQKAAFTSSAVFTGQGFSFSRAYYGDSSFLPKTTNIDNAAAQHRPGVLVNNGGTVQMIVNGGLWGIPSLDVFNSWGYSFADVVPSNSADRMLAQIGVIPARMAGELSPSGVTGGPTPTATPTGVTPGLEGTLDASLFATPSNNTVVNEGDNNVSVMGIELEADDSSITVERIYVNVAATPDTRPWAYMDNMSLYDGSTMLKSMDVTGSGSFSEVSTNVYRATFSGLNVVVPKDGSKVLTVKVSALNTIDSADLGVDGTTNVTLTVPLDGVRGIDGAGITQYAPTLAFSRGVDFQGEESSDVTVSVAAGNLDDRTVEVSEDEVTENIELLKFTIKVEDQAMELDTLTAILGATDSTGTAKANVADVLNTAKLYKDSTLIDSVTIASPDNDEDGAGTTSVSFDADNLDLSVGTHTFYIKANANDTGASFAEGDKVWAQLGDGESVEDDTVLSGEDMNSNLVTLTEADVNVMGNEVSFYIEFPEVSVSSKVISITPDTNTEDAAGTMVIDITARGGDIYIDETGDVDLAKIGDTSAQVNLSSTYTANVSKVGTEYHIQEGQTARFTINFVLDGDADNSNNGAGAFVGAELSAIQWSNIAGGTEMNINFDGSMYETEKVYVTNAN